MGDAQSAQRDGKSEAAAEEQSAVEHGPSGESTQDQLMQNNGQISECNSKPVGTTADVNGPCEDQFAKEAVVVEDKGISVIGSAPEEVANVQIIQEDLPDPNEGEEPIEIINMDAKQNDLNESFRRFFSNIGLKLTVKKGSGDQADDKAEKDSIAKLDVSGETTNGTKHEDAEQTTDLNAIQDNDSTTCPTLTDGTSDDVAETVEEKITETKEIADNAEGQEANVTVDEKDCNQSDNATLEQSPTNQEDEEFVSPIKKFFTTGIFAGLKKKKIEEAEDKELVDMSKNYADAKVDQQDIMEASPNVEEQETECKERQEETAQALEPPEDEDRGKSPTTDQDSESEITSSQERVQSSPLKRLFSGTTFKRRSKRQKGRRSSDSKLSDSDEQTGNQIVASNEKTEQQDTVVENPSPPPLATDPEEEMSAWEAFKKLMTAKKSLKRSSVGSEEVQVQAVAVEETKPSEGERVSDHSTEEGRKRKDSSHSWEAVLCGSGRRRSRKTSDSEDEQKQDAGEVESPNEAGDVVISTPKQAGSPSDSESSTWKSFKKLMTPKRKVKDEEESKDHVQSDSEATLEETLFSIKKLLPSRKKGKSGEKQDQLSSDEGDKEVVSMEEDSETPAVVPLSEFDKSETEETAKTDVEIQDSDLESEQEHILEIPKTFVQEVQEHQVTPIIPLNQDQDELTEFSKYKPLSDIPEEGNITETVATSLIEDVAKDDTIADDMVELTSEAITAPEPVDITMADETDELMLSAASHLTESSKTSGNATPVPVEYDVKDTEVLLKEVVETISTATKANIFCSEEPALERVVGSVTEKFERSVCEEQNVMELHAQSDAVTFETGLQVDQIKNTDVQIPVTVLSENLSEFKDAISTEYVSEVSKVEFESAKMDFDEVHTAQRKGAVKQESVDDSDYMIESLSEVPYSIDVDENMGQDALPGEPYKEPEAVLLVLLTQEKVEEIDDLVAEQSESEDAELITSEPELLKGEADSVVEIYEEEAIQKHEALQGSAEINETVQPEAEEITDVLPHEGTPELNKELLNEQTPIHKVTETNVEVEIVAEDDFEIFYKKNVGNIQMPTLESQNLSKEAVEEAAMQVEATGPVTDSATKENIATEEPEQEVIGANDQYITEEHTSEINVEAGREEVSVTETPTEQKNREQPDGFVPEVAISQVEEAAMQVEATVPVTDVATKEEIIETKATKEPEQEVIGANDQDITEEQSSEINVETGKEEVSVTETPTEQENIEKPDSVVSEVAISQVEEVAMQVEATVPVTDLATKEEIIETIATKEPEQEVIGVNDQDITEEQSSETNVEAGKEGVSATETPTEQESRQPDGVVPEVAVSQVEEVAMQVEATVPVTDLATKEEIIETIATEEPEQEVIGENDQEITEEQSSETNVEAGKEGVSATETPTEQESRQPEGVVPEVAVSQVEVGTNKLLEETFEEELIEQSVPSSDQEMMEQINEVSTEAGQQDNIGELEDKPLSDVAADEIDDKVLDTTESQQHEMVTEEGTTVLNGLIIVSSAEECETETISQLDHSLHVNGDHSEAKPSDAQTMQLNHRHEVTEDIEALPIEHVSSVNEKSGIAQVLENTINIEKHSEMFLSTTEEPIHEVLIGEMEVNVEEQREEEIPCPVTDVAEVEHAALLKESIVTLQKVAATMPDLMIQKSDEDSDKIAEESSIPCLDNAEVLDESKHEVQLTAAEQVGIQGEKEEQIISPEATTVAVQHTAVAQLTTFSFKDVVSQLPDVSIETTTEIHEPILGVVVSEQVEQETIETTTPLEVNNVTQVAQEGTTVIEMHVPAVKFEDKHQVQVQVVNMDIQSAKARVDQVMEIGVQEDKEVVYFCHETAERVDSFSATSNIEPEIISESDTVAVQDVFQHVKDIATESEEPEYKELPIDLAESKLSDYCKMIESQDQPPDVTFIQDSVMATKEQVLTKMDEDVKDVQEQAFAQNQVATPGNTAVALPQNTGKLSSVSNMEAPSSLSLEFKLNIQFGQSKAETLQPRPTHFATEQTISTSPQSPKAPTVDRKESAKTTEMSEVGVQAVEEEAAHENEPKKSEIVMAEVAVQATETTAEPDMMETVKKELMNVGIQSAKIEEPIKEMAENKIIQYKTVLMDVSTQYTEISEEEIIQGEIAMADNQPVLIDVGTQSIQQEETNEEVKTTVVEISSIQLALEPVQSNEDKRVLQTELVVHVSNDQIKQTEDDDENQDVWMDAKEDIDAQEQITTMPICEIEESFESEPEYFQETKTDFEESLENIKKIALKCDIDSEGEDFAVALEDPQIATVIATVEWD